MRAQPIPDVAWPVLRCPQCAAPLQRATAPIRCSCGVAFPWRESGSLDLRLQRPRQVRIDFEIGTPPSPAGFAFEPLEPNAAPQVDYTGVRRLWHLGDALRSYIPRASRAGAIALDLGCGTGLHREICERAGYAWLGLDYNEPEAAILGDAHALPLADASVEMVLSLAVLEHLRYPFVAAGEVMRVLQPGGIYLGSVSFLEPFHSDSYYHHSYLGVHNTLATAGFEVLRVAPQANWTGLHGLAHMALFPRLPSRLRNALVMPLDLLSRAVWAVGRRFNPSKTPSERLRLMTGAFDFVARKPVG